jgi:hypothetical protein
VAEDCVDVEYGGVAEDRNFENIRKTINDVKPTDNISRAHKVS